MATSKQLHLLATSARAHIDFLTTGNLPEGQKPTGPLVDLLKAISPRDLGAIAGVTIDERLGYRGSRRFHCAAQAFRWIHPDAEVFGSFPAESWRIKRETTPLHIEGLLECAARAPENLADRYPRLRRPTKSPKP